MQENNDQTIATISTLDEANRLRSELIASENYLWVLIYSGDVFDVSIQNQWGGHVSNNVFKRCKTIAESYNIKSSKNSNNSNLTAEETCDKDIILDDSSFQ